MKKLIFLLGICLIFLSCGPKFNDAIAKAVIQEAFELSEDDTLEILGTSMESKDIALVKFKLNDVQISSEMRQYDKGWKLDEIQNDFGMWVPAENSINEFKRQKTKEEIESLGKALTKLIRDNKGFQESSKKIEILMPSYLNSIPTHDKWGIEYRIKVKNSDPIPINGKIDLFFLGVDEYFILLAGPDKKFYSEDDIVWNYHGYWPFNDFKDFLNRNGNNL